MHQFPLIPLKRKKRGWKEVQKQDKFFSKTDLIKTKEEFVEILLKDRILKGIDVAKYILTKIPCTHLKLEKLVYLCYADYLCAENKKSGINFVEDNKKTEDESHKKLPIRSRIIASKEGLQKIFSIDKTLEKYGHLNANELVNMKHKKFSPWNYAGAGQFKDKEISDDLILKFHQNEIL